MHRRVPLRFTHARASAVMCYPKFGSAPVTLMLGLRLSCSYPEPLSVQFSLWWAVFSPGGCGHAHYYCHGPGGFVRQAISLFRPLGLWSLRRSLSSVLWVVESAPLAVFSPGGCGRAHYYCHGPGGFVRQAISPGGLSVCGRGAWPWLLAARTGT